MSFARSNIQAMIPYCPPLDKRSAYPGLRLDFNERTLPPPASVLQALRDFSLEFYPEYFDLSERIAAYVGVSSEQIMVTNGSDQGMDLIFRTFTRAGDPVVIPSPSFVMYDQCAQIEGNTMLRPIYPLDLSFPFEEVMDSITPEVRLVVLCNPNNPTGTPIPLEQIEAILEKASSAMVYVDEAYYEFSGETAVPLLSRYPNLVITRTFSKAFGIPALRVGYVVASAENIRELLKVRGPYDVNMAGACAAREALGALQEIRQYVDEVMKETKPMVEAFFRENAVEFFPSRANFILFRPSQSAEDVFQQLAANGILTRPRKGPNIENTIRFSIGTVDQMKQFISTYQRLFLNP